MKRTRLEDAEREWEEQEDLERDTFMEQSLAATMIALEADFEMPATPRRYDEDAEEDGIDMDAHHTHHSRRAPGSSHGLSQRLGSSSPMRSPPRSSAMNRTTGGIGRSGGERRRNTSR